MGKVWVWGPGFALPPPCAPVMLGLCGHSASFPHGVVTSRADGEPRGRALLLAACGGKGWSGEGFLEEIPELEA